MIYIFCIFYILSILLSGYSVMLLIFPEERRPFYETYALSYALGSGVMGGFLFLASLYFGVVPSRLSVFSIFLISASLIVAVKLWTAERQKEYDNNWYKTMHLKLNIIPLFSIVVIFLVFVVVCCHSLLMPLYEWDSFAIWGFKAKVFFYEDLKSSQYFYNPNLGYSHPDYPLLVSLLTTGVYASIGYIDETAGKIIFPFFYLAFICLIYTAIRWKLQGKYSLLLTAVFASTPALVRWSGAGTADVALTFFHMGTIFYMIKYFNGGKMSDLIFAGLFNSLCLFTKNEGLALSIINIFVFMIFCISAGKYYKPIIILSLCSIIPCVPWIIFSLGIPRIHENYLACLDPSDFPLNINRLTLIIQGFFNGFISIAKWGIMWILLLILLAACFKSLKNKTFLLLSVLLVSHLVLYIFIYSIYPYDFNELLNSTLDRLILHMLPEGILIITFILSTMINDRSCYETPGRVVE